MTLGGWSVTVGDGRVVRSTAPERNLFMADRRLHPLTLAGSVAVLAILTAALFMGIAEASPVVEIGDTVTVERFAGVDRFDTAAQLSRAAFPNGAGTVFIVRADDPADALATGPVAGLTGAPVLLTWGDTLPTVTADEIARLDPTRVAIVGGEGAISREVADAIYTAAAS